MLAYILMVYIFLEKIFWYIHSLRYFVFPFFRDILMILPQKSSLKNDLVYKNCDILVRIRVKAILENKTTFALRNNEDGCFFPVFVDF